MKVKKNLAKYFIIAAALTLGAFLFFGVIVPSGIDFISRAPGGDLAVCYKAAALIAPGISRIPLYRQGNFPDVAATDTAAPQIIDNVYPPFWGWLLIPLTKIPFSQALAAWRLLNVVFLGIAIWLLGKINFPREIWRRHRQLVTAGLVGLIMLVSFSWPVITALGEGQVNILILLLLAASLWGYGRRHQIGSAFFLALGGAIKIWPLFMLFYFLVKKNTRWVLFTLLTFVLLTLLPLPWVGGETFSAFLTRDLFLASAPFNVLYSQGLFSLLGKLFGPSVDFQPILDLSPLLPYLKGAAVCLVLVVLWRQLRQTQNLIGGFSLTVLALLLIWPVSWVHTFVLLLIPLFFVAGMMIKRKFRLPRAVIAGVIVIGVVFMIPWPKSVALLSPWAANYLTLATLGLWVITWWFIKSERWAERN